VGGDLTSDPQLDPNAGHAAPKTSRTASRIVLALALGVGGSLLAACGAPASGPQETISSFLASWSSHDWTAAKRLVAHPPANFVAINVRAASDLGLQHTSFTIGPIAQSAATARAPVTEHLTLFGFGAWNVRTTLHLTEESDGWRVDWSPSTIDPSLGGGDAFEVTTTWPTRAPILGAGGVSLTTQDKSVDIGVEGSFVKDPGSLASALVAAGSTSGEAEAALAAAKVHPTYFEPVFTVSWARYLELKPTLYPLPGTVFQVTEEREAITPGLEAHLVGAVGPVTAEELHQLGASYDSSSVVGQTGLEQVDESQLAGNPGYTISVVNASGATVANLAQKRPRPGTPVVTSIDPTIQLAAEAALSGETKHAALVAVNATTGQILASVSDPSNDGFDQALDGVFPPGSTFKTITSTALVEGGLSPTSPASCPTTIDVGGESFHNAEGDAPVQDLEQAFTESCNTAFIGLATKDLTPSSLPASAAQFGIGRTPNMGIPAFGGAVPTPRDKADLAATAIGQGRVLVSPLDMAMVAAAIDSGTVRRPRLVIGAPDDSAPTHALPKDVVNDLHEMMADVVSSGTAANQGLPPGTYAKTGTAEYGSDNPPQTDAWLIGFRGHVAFAVLVVDGGLGGPTCGPIAAAFLKAIGSR
jgi:hypothetical protein